MPAKDDISTSQVRLLDFLTGYRLSSAEVAEIRQSAKTRRSCRATSMQHSAWGGQDGYLSERRLKSESTVHANQYSDPTNRQSVDHNEPGVVDLKRSIGD